MQTRSLISFINRISDLEDNIFKLKNENEEFTKKIKLLKNKQNSHSRELEVYNRDKEYPTRVYIASNLDKHTDRRN